MELKLTHLGLIRAFQAFEGERVAGLSPPHPSQGASTGPGRDGSVCCCIRIGLESRLYVSVQQILDFKTMGSAHVTSVFLQQT